MIAIIDYGVGNLFSMSSSLKYIGESAVITDKKETLEGASHLILPGVGAFGDAMEKLRRSGLIPTLKRQAESGKPLLGVCLGMQMLFQESLEYGRHEGLGLLEGRICPMEPVVRNKGLDLKVPQIGWNSLSIGKPDCALMKNTRQGDFVYYVHSFYATDCEESLVAWSDYGVNVPGVVARGNVFGTQFHPEKSGAVGLDILRAFCSVQV